MKKMREWMTSFHQKIQAKPRGQTLVEFALALPILLMLTFGIIEFGRMMHAYLALENGSRFAVRFAITGNYDPAYCDDAVSALAGSLSLSSSEQADGADDCVVHTAAGKIDNDKTSALQDWARLPSIRDAALAGTTGITWDPSSAVSGDYLAFLQNAYTTANLSQDFRGNPSEAGYFGITTCSNRVLPVSGDFYRFNPNTLFYSPNPTGTDPDYAFPIYCELSKGDNSGTIRYVDDAGGPGDRVRVVLTYRYNVITPFLSSIWPTIRLKAEREGLVEKFRTSRVTGLSGRIMIAATHTYTPPPPTETLTPTNTPTPYSCTGTGTVLREWWTDISGNSVSNLTTNDRYPYEPSGSNFPTSFEAPTSFGDNYGTRMQAYLCPPYSGVYTFWIASDDNSELWLSASDNPAGAAKIANVSDYTSSRQWDKFSSQKSVGITLQAGQLYYIQALHKEGGGGDNLAVAWAGPGVSESATVIDGQYLIPVSPVHVPTRTPTSTPPPNCNVIENLSLSSGSYEGLMVQYYSSSDTGYVLESNLKNLGPYTIAFTGASMTYNGAWHNAMQSPDPDRSFDLYSWNSNYSNVMYNPSNTSALTYTHTFTTPKSLSAGSSGYFRWTYDRSNFNFWITPYVRSYPIPANNKTPTPARDPFDGSTIYRNFYWNSDFNGVVRYNVIPASGPTLACQITVTGKTGPSIQTVYTPGNPITGTSFAVRAIVEGNQGLSGTDQNVNEVRFFVYNSQGTLVHWYRDTSAQFCLFGGNSSCTTRKPNVDYWWYGSSSSLGPQITNGSYTLVIMAQNNDADNRKKSTLIVEPFTISGALPTVTRTSAPTRTPTITSTPTKTGTTTKTPTKSPIPSNTPIPTITRTPTKTNTVQPSITPTKCQTPIELGGCR